MEVIEVKKGESYAAQVGALRAQSISLVDCSVLFDSAAFQVSGVAIDPGIAGDFDLAESFDTGRLNLLLSVKGDGVLDGDAVICGFSLFVTDQAEVGKTYEIIFSQESFALGKPAKAGKPGADIPTEWRSATLSIQESLMQVIYVRVIA